ncbi:MAG: transcription termination factor NusA [Candidatus Nanoperiomorbaceae bacterium]
MDEINLKQLTAITKVIADEKNLPEEAVLDAIQKAIAAAWRRDHEEYRNALVSAVLNENDGTAKITARYDVVDEPEGTGQISLEEAKKIDKAALINGTIEETFEAKSFGRVAAQTAKQVLIQTLRDDEREVLAKEFDDKVGHIITGAVTRIEPRVVRIDLGKGEGIMPASEQIPNERLMVGSRVRVLLKKIDRESGRGATLILSRGDKDFVGELFKQEVPEIDDGTVEIKVIAREAGRRTKIAVMSSVTGVDPVGTFVGAKGVRVSAVINEIGDNEKIDIVTWDADVKNFIANALSPAEISRIDLTGENEEGEKTATVFVLPAQQSIAIGKQGQNVRLASQLTGYLIEIATEE